MPVYVDAARIPYRGMLMSHCWADSRDELLAMMDRIGVQRKWLQKPPKASWEHFDISEGKRQLALAYGAVLTDRYGPVEHEARRLLASPKPEMQEAGRRKLDMVLRARAGRPNLEPQETLL